MPMFIFGQKVRSLKIQSSCKALPDTFDAQKYGFRCVSRSFRSFSSEAQFSSASLIAFEASGLLRQVCHASKDMVRSTLLLFLESGGPSGLHRKYHDYLRIQISRTMNLRIFDVSVDIRPKSPLFENSI